MPVVSLTAGNPTARAEPGEIKAPKQPLEERGFFPPSPAEMLHANPPRCLLVQDSVFVSTGQ